MSKKMKNHEIEIYLKLNAEHDFLTAENKVLTERIRDLEYTLQILNIRTCTHESKTICIGMPPDEIHVKDFYARIRCDTCHKILEVFETEKDYLLYERKLKEASLHNIDKQIEDLEEQ